MITHDSTELQLVEDERTVRYFYLVTKKAEYRGLTMEQAIDVWQGHRTQDKTPIQHFGSVG